MDQFTKMIRLKVTTIAVLLKKITKIYLDKIWKIYRVPWKILSNRRPQFISKFIKNFTKAIRIKIILSIYIILKWMDKQNELTKKLKYSCDIM